jgi:hypothetical protein
MYCSNQTIEIDNEIEHRENMLVGFIFHPDLIRATSLNDKLNYSFSIEVSEALHLSDKEKYWSV